MLVQPNGVTEEAVKISVRTTECDTLNYIGQDPGATGWRVNIRITWEPHRLGKKRRKWYLSEKSLSNADKKSGEALATVAWLAGALLRGQEIVGSTPSLRACRGQLADASLSCINVSLPSSLSENNEEKMSSGEGLKKKNSWGKIYKNVKKQMKTNEAIIHSREIKMI